MWKKGQVWFGFIYIIAGNLWFGGGKERNSVNMLLQCCNLPHNLHNLTATLQNVVTQFFFCEQGSKLGHWLDLSSQFISILSSWKKMYLHFLLFLPECPIVNCPTTMQESSDSYTHHPKHRQFPMQRLAAILLKDETFLQLGQGD